MRMMTFAKRCGKEILRDPLNLLFGLGFPVILLLLLSAIQANVPVPLFEIQHLTPGITVFGLSFMTLFSATLVSKDRESAFLQRLYTTPLRPADYILGYMLPLLSMALLQCVVYYVFAIFLGFRVTVNLFFGVLMILPVSSISVGMKRRAIVIIMENSCTGRPIFLKGDKSLSIASVRATGEVVYVKSTKVLIIRHTIRSAIRSAYLIPSG